MKIKDALTTRSIAFVEIPFSSLKTGTIYAASYHLFHMDPSHTGGAGDLQLSFLFTMKEKASFLGQVSRFSHQDAHGRELEAHLAFDEKTGGYVMLTSGDEELGEDPTYSKRPSVSSMVLPPTASDLASGDELSKSPAKRNFSILSMIREPLFSFSVSFSRT